VTYERMKFSDVVCIISKFKVHVTFVPVINVDVRSVYCSTAGFVCVVC